MITAMCAADSKNSTMLYEGNWADYCLIQSVVIKKKQSDCNYTRSDEWKYQSGHIFTF